jgi:hypothetical protein
VRERFTSFDDAWRHFVGRTERLESFWAELPDEADATLDIWIAEPPAPVKDAALQVQRSFAELSWIAPLPRDFLHVTLRPEVDWPSVAPFEAAFGPVCCFPVAVVAEVGAPAVEELVADPFFLPHLSLGYFRETHDPEPLRRAVEPLRDAELGRCVVREVSRVRVPFSTSRFLEPWTVLETVALEDAR